MGGLTDPILVLSLGAGTRFGLAICHFHKLVEAGRARLQGRSLIQEIVDPEKKLRWSSHGDRGQLFQGPGMNFFL